MISDSSAALYTSSRHGYLSDESLAVVNCKECLMHAVRGHLEVTDLAGDHVRVELWLLFGVSLRFKYRDVSVEDQQVDGAVEGAKLLHLVGAPSSRRCLVLNQQEGVDYSMCKL